MCLIKYTWVVYPSSIKNSKWCAFHFKRLQEQTLGTVINFLQKLKMQWWRILFIYSFYPLTARPILFQLKLQKKSGTMVNINLMKLLLITNVVSDLDSTPRKYQKIKPIKGICYKQVSEQRPEFISSMHHNSRAEWRPWIRVRIHGRLTPCYFKCWVTTLTMISGLRVSQPPPYNSALT